MSDFMLSFYNSYIRPQLYDIKEGEYTEDFQKVFDHLPEDLLPSLYKCEEFTAIHAFLLGLRVAAGLSAAW